MSDVEYAQRGFRDSRLALHAVSALPAWLWSPDGMRLLWANAAGAAVFGRGNSPDVSTLDIAMADPHRLQVAQLSGRLPQNGQPRLERLRGFGAPLGRLMTCACSRLQFADADIGILIAAAEPSGRTLPLAERLNRLIEGLDAPVAAFLADGRLSAATPSARGIIGDSDHLEALGLDALRRDTLETGRAEFASERGRFVLHRVGSGADVAIIAVLTPPATAPAGNETAAEMTADLSAAPEPGTGTQTGPTAQSAAGAILHSPEAADHFPALLTRAIEAMHAGRDRSAGEDASPAANSSPAEMAPAEALAEAPADLPPASAPPAVSVPAKPQEATSGPQNPFEEPLLPVRRQPLRFMWQMDADGRFSLGADEFSRLMGPRTATAFGRPWREINAAFGIDPEGRIAAAIASRDTWSNLPVAWPVDDGGELAVELSGLPVFDRSQRFIGYRGFGVCRDIDGMERLATLRRQDRFNPSGNAVQAHTDNSGSELHLVTGGAEAEAAPPPNVVPFRAPGETRHPVLTPVENHAFNELARQLNQRLNPEPTAAPSPSEPVREPETASVVHLSEAAQRDDKPPAPPPPRDISHNVSHDVMRPLLDRLPVGVLIYRLDRLIYANRAFLQRTGYVDLGALTDAGGLDALFVEPVGPETSSTSETGTHLVISTLLDSRDPVNARLFTIPWEEETALALIFSPPGETQAAPSAPPLSLSAPPPPAPLDPDPRDAEIEELRMALAAARQQIEHAATDRSDVLARISHEIRTPMNAIIGFADVMIDERFGPIGNERYAEYLKDVRASGEQIMAMINDMLDLSRAETGKLDLTFTQFALNELVEQCVAVMQPQANRERIIIRTSLAHTLPLIKADMRTARQVIINLIGNAIRLAQAGGQVIVSTALTDDGAVAIRVRDTGAGMSEGEIAAALEPFRSPSPVAGDGVSTAGFNLSLTKALAEANRARLAIRSGSHAGTLAEVVFDHSA